MIKISKLNKVYNDKKYNANRVVNNMSIELAEKGMVAFFGKSGCGKTTLLNLIGGLDKSQSGKIEIDGQIVTSRNVDDIRNEYIGYIFQNYNLDENKSVFDNVATALRIMGITDKETIKQRVMCALENVELEKFAKRRPSSLSGGQQQRIAIARAIVKCPKIILADEPTGNLDEFNTVKVMDILKKISKDRLVLLVTHESELVDVYCDQIVELVDGKIKSNVMTQNSESVTVRDNNKIYLGDMDSTQSDIAGVKIEYYGEQSLESNIKIIEKDGKLFIYTLNDNVKFIDSRSEISVVAEKFEEKNIAASVQSLDMTALTPLKHKKSKMFTVWDGIKSGYAVTFKQGKMMKKMLIAVLLIFPIVITLLFSLMYASVGFEDDLEFISSNEEIVTVNVRMYSEYEKLIELINDPKNQIIGSTINDGRYGASNMIPAMFSVSTFMTTDSAEYQFDVNKLPYTSYNGKMAHGVSRPSNTEIVINLGIAEKIIDSKLFGSVKKPSQLMGSTITINYENYTVVGIADEYSDYVYTSYAVANDNVYNVQYNCFTTEFQQGQDFDLQKGEVVIDYDKLNQYYHSDFEKGSKFDYDGQSFTVVDTIGTSDSVNINPVDELPGDFLEFGGNGSLIVTDEFYQQLAYSPNEENFRGFTCLVATENLAAVNQHCDDLNLESLDYLESIEDWMKYNNNSIMAIIWSVIAAIMTITMTLCIYFIMRTSLMNRVKEVGIYRAIGASRYDIIKNFFIEFLVMFMLTIFVGFMITSSLIWILMSSNPMIISMIYLPFWLWLSIGSGVFVLSTICALLPLILLITKTPAEILAKYDI